MDGINYDKEHPRDSCCIWLCARNQQKMRNNTYNSGLPKFAPLVARTSLGPIEQTISNSEGVLPFASVMPKWIVALADNVGFQALTLWAI